MMEHVSRRPAVHAIVIVLINPVRGHQADAEQNDVAHCTRRASVANRMDTYFNCVEIEEKVVLSFVPTPFTAVMMTRAMPAAIRLYSMAVAPDSSLRKAMTYRIVPKS